MGQMQAHQHQQWGAAWQGSVTRQAGQLQLMDVHVRTSWQNGLLYCCLLLPRCADLYDPL